MRKIISIVLFFSSMSLKADIISINPPTNFQETEVTDNTINFTWKDNSSGEDKYVVCVKDKYGNYQNCSSDLAENTESYTYTGITPYTNKKYVVIVSNSDNSDHEESNAIYVKTTHTWNGELQKCINEDLGYGEDNTTHIPTKSELEAYNSDFECSNRGDMISDINPVVDLINITKFRPPDLGKYFYHYIYQ